MTSLCSALVTLPILCSQRTYAELVIALTHLDAHLRESIEEGDDETEGTA